MIDIIPNWHPVLVHFTVAPLALAVMLSLVTPFLREGKVKEQWRAMARWNLWFGTAFAVLTALAGWYAYNTVVHDTPSHAAMTEHRDWALGTLVVFLGLTAWSMRSARSARKPGLMFNGLLLAAGVLLASTAWHGGELVYRHGLGVMSLPQQEGEGHDHEHTDDQMHAPGISVPDGAATHPDKQTEDAVEHVRMPKTPAAPDAKTTAPNRRARSAKPHNSDGHTHTHQTPD